MRTMKKTLTAALLGAGMMATAMSVQAAGTPPAHPFKDAVKVWHFADDTGLKAEGAAKTGVKLEGEEKAASLARGGDGSVATLDGGHFLTRGDLKVTGKQMTLLARARDRSGNWDGALLAEHSPDSPCANILYGSALDLHRLGMRERKRMKDGRSIEFLWRTSPLQERVIPGSLNEDSPYDAARSRARGQDCSQGLLRLAAPVELIGPSEWHDIVVRFDGPKLDLFVDGVLVDEEYPHGDLRMFTAPLLIGAGIRNGKLTDGFKGEIDHIAVWDRALPDAEIAELSGGAERIAKRRIEIEGPPEPNLQYWRPSGYNMFVGDPMPFFHDGVFHFFYLTDREHHSQKWTIGAHPWGHASSRDLIHWEHHPRALDFCDQTENAMGTGQFIVHDGIWHLFWINHGRRMPWTDAPEHRLADNIYLATSHDGVHFEKHTDQPWARIDYMTGGDVNPIVWKTAKGDRYYMYCPNNKKTEPPNAMPPWLFESKDLKTWTPVPSPNFADEFPKGWNSCATYHEWNGWYYFHTGGVYWMSRHPLEDPGAERTVRHGLAVGLGVPEWSAFKDNRRIGVGFATGLGYAGEAVFRELVQFPDGRLGTKWPGEMIPESGAPVGSIPDALSLRAAGKTGSQIFSHIPQDVRITARVVPGPGTSGFGVTVRATDGQSPSGPSLWFDPVKERFECRVSEDVDTGSDPHLRTKALSGVTGLDQPFILDLIVKGDFIDICIDNRHTCFHRLRDKKGNVQLGEDVTFFVEKGEVEFKDIAIRPLE